MIFQGEFVKRKYQTSLSFRQALYTIFVGTLFAILISGFLVYQDLNNVHQRIDDMIEQMVGVVKDSASQAAYEIDAARARGTISGIFKDKAILEVAIIDDFGTLLAHSMKYSGSPESDWLVNWLFSGKMDYSEPLVWGKDHQKVGEIQITMNARHVARDFFGRSIRTTVSTFGLVFILTGAFMLLFYSFTIRPILGIVRLVSSVDTDNPGEETIDIPKKHEHDELGRLVSAINQLIKGYGHSLAASQAAEAKIKQSEARYRLLFDFSPLGIVTIDPQGKIIEVNPKLLEILGSPSVQDTREINMFTLSNLIDAGIAENFRKSVETGLVGNFETFYTSKWGRHFFMRYHVQPIRNEKGVISGVQGLMEDITEEKRLAEQLKQTQKLEAVGTLAGGISHDFNNILQAITGYTQLILFDKKEIDTEYANLLSVKKSAERAAQLVRKLLLFSRKAETELNQLDLNQEVIRAASLLERTISGSIQVNILPGTRLCNVYADHVQIEQLIMELGKNAADAMPDGGTLVIRTENVTLDEAYSRARLGAEPGPYVLLTVSDTGQGMEKDVVDHVFEPFFSTKEIGQGSGLGLAAVYGIVKMHGGYILINSKVGLGTSVHIYLPAILQPDADQCAETKGGTETILLVDDEESIRGLAAQILKRYGYTVHAAAGGEQALEIYSRNPRDIDLVIMDVGMPGMDGQKCLEEILRVNATAKVVMATGYTVHGATETEKVLEAGAVDYISKPYQPRDLLEKVRNVLDGYA